MEEREPVPAGQRGFHQVPPYKTRPADDEDVHNSSISSISLNKYIYHPIIVMAARD
jgi:hypothetical protein